MTTNQKIDQILQAVISLPAKIGAQIATVAIAMSGMDSKFSDRFDRIDAEQARQSALIEKVAAEVLPPPAKAKMSIAIQVGNLIFQGDSEMTILASGQTATARIAKATDAAGNETTFESLAWSASDPAKLSLVPNPDGTCQLTGVLAGPVQLIATADGDVDPSKVVTVTALADIQVTPGVAAALLLEISPTV